jgi:hypothetical protein
MYIYLFVCVCVKNEIFIWFVFLFFSLSWLGRRSRPSCQTRKIWAIITIILLRCQRVMQIIIFFFKWLQHRRVERHQQGEKRGKRIDCTFPIGKKVKKKKILLLFKKKIRKETNKSNHSRWRGEREREPSARIISNWPVCGLGAGPRPTWWKRYRTARHRTTLVRAKHTEMGI